MQCVKGIWFPDEEQHLVGMVNRGPIVNGKGTYQYEKLIEALKYVQHYRCAIDVGMHVGLWAMHLATKFKTVIGFEPVQKHIECLKLNMEGFDNYQVHNCALGNQRKQVGLKFFPGNSGGTQIFENGGNDANMFKLDDFNLDTVDFIKIDVENYEPFVLEGGERTIRRQKPVIIIEQKGTKDNINRAPEYQKTKYGRDQYDAKRLLQRWGAREKFNIHGDICLSWK